MAQHEQNGQENGFEQVERIALQSESFLEKNLKVIIGSVGAILLLVCGWYGYTKLIKEPRNEKASAALMYAEDRFLNQQDSLALAGSGLTEKGLDAIINEYSGTDAANLAHAYKGIALYDAGQYEEAIAALKAFDSKDAYVAPSVVRLIGDCYAQLEKYQEAADAYEQAAKMASNEAITPGALIKAGHVYEKLGQSDKALALYNEVKEKYGSTPEGLNVEVEIVRASSAK